MQGARILSLDLLGVSISGFNRPRFLHMDKALAPSDILRVPVAFADLRAVPVDFFIDHLRPLGD